MNAPTENPLTEATYFILLSLSSKPKHGYAIMKDVQVLSEKKVMLSTSTLYGALGRLLDQGLIERLFDEDEVETGRPRKVYRLTGDGLSVLEAEIARLQTLVQTAKLQLSWGDE